MPQVELVDIARATLRSIRFSHVQTPIEKHAGPIVLTRLHAWSKLITNFGIFLFKVARPNIYYTRSGVSENAY